MVTAACFCSTASSSSTAKLVFSSAVNGIPLGLKNVTDGSQQTHRHFLGLAIVTNKYSLLINHAAIKSGRHRRHRRGE